MTEVIEKIHMNDNEPFSMFVEVTADSISNQAMLIGYSTPNRKVVVFKEDVDKLIETLQLLKTKYL